MRVKELRGEVQRLVNQRPFQPFILNLENGDRITIEHPENIAFDPSNENHGSAYFYVVTRGLRFGGTFHAVTSVVEEDTGQASQV